MLTTSFFFLLFTGTGLIGALLWGESWRRRHNAVHERADTLGVQLQDAFFQKEKAELTLSHTTQQFEERISFLTQTHASLEDHMRLLCADVLQQSQKNFLTQAEGLLGRLQQITQGELGQQHEKLNFLMTPLAKALSTIDEKIQTLEKSRVGAYEALVEQLKSLTSTQKDLHQQTHQLVQALRTPHVRGRWGEIQLRRLVELAGMLSHCDFSEQASVSSETGRLLRPDLTITLPGRRQIIIDAKVPLLSYMNGLECDDPALQKKHMKDHARLVRQHIKTLSDKKYWSQFNPSPEFVLLFLPSETLLTAALEEDKDLLDYGAESQVLIATPMTLLALLKTIALGWHQHSINENAERVSRLGRDLYRRLQSMMGAFHKMGQNLSFTLTTYHETVSSLEKTILPETLELGRLTEIGGGHRAPPSSLSSAPVVLSAKGGLPPSVPSSSVSAAPPAASAKSEGP